VAALARIALGAPGGAAAQQVRRELADRALQEEKARRSAQDQAGREAEALTARNAEASAPAGPPAGARRRTDRQQEPAVVVQEYPRSADTWGQPADRVVLQASEAEGRVSEARPHPPALPAPGRDIDRAIRRKRYFWISGGFLAVMIAGIIANRVASPHSVLSTLMGGLYGVGIAGALVTLCLGVWWSRTSQSNDALLCSRERYFWISGAFLLVMISGIAGKIYQVHAYPRSGLSVLMGLVIGVGAVGALVMFGLGVWLGHARRLFPPSSMPAHPWAGDDC
jgi:hypothetical protein